MAEVGTDLPEQFPPALTFEERQEAKKRAEHEANQREQENLTNNYLERTGRKEMIP